MPQAETDSHTPPGKQNREKIKHFSSRCVSWVTKNNDVAKQSRSEWERGSNHPILCSPPPQKKGQLEKRGLLWRGDAGGWLKCDTSWNTQHLLPLTHAGHAENLWRASASASANAGPASWRGLFSWGWGFSGTAKTWRKGRRWQKCSFNRQLRENEPF